MGQARDYLERLRARIEVEGPTLALDEGGVGIFDSTLIAETNRTNYAGLNMPATLAESLPFIPRRTIAWEDVRKILTRQARRLCDGAHARALHARMLGAAESLAGAPTDLTQAVARIFFRAATPLILAEAIDETAALEAEQECRLQELLPLSAHEAPLGMVEKTLRSARVGGVIKRALAHRRAAPADHEDILGAIAEHDAQWGRDRAAYVATTLLTAIAAAPGFVAACVLLELARRPRDAEAIGEELRRLTIEDLAANAEAAVLTRRFVAETLRLWSFPLVVKREALKRLHIGSHVLEAGDTYLLSSYIMHRDAVRWPAPDVFNAERWIDESAQLPPYAFGWAPRACVGASIGLLQLLIFCRIVTVDCRLETIDLDRAFIDVGGFAAPKNFRGALCVIAR